MNAATVYGNSIPFRDITSATTALRACLGFDLCTGRGSWLYERRRVGRIDAADSPISNGSQTIIAGKVSDPMGVTISSAPSSDLTVNLSSSSKTGTFSSASVTIPAHQTSSDAFTYTDTKAGTPTLTASAGGASSGITMVTVDAAALANIAVSPDTATVPAGGTQTFTATGEDAYKNPVPVSGVTWSTSPDTLGSVDPGPGSSTVFTAGSNVDNGSVTATLDGVLGTANVTITSLSALTVTVTAGTFSRRRHNYQVTVSAADAPSGQPVGGAGVTLNVYSGSTCTGTAVATDSGTTRSNGQASFTFSTRQHSSWCALATVNATGYSTDTGQTNFST